MRISIITPQIEYASIEANSRVEGCVTAPKLPTIKWPVAAWIRTTRLDNWYLWAGGTMASPAYRSFISVNRTSDKTVRRKIMPRIIACFVSPRMLYQCLHNLFKPLQPWDNSIFLTCLNCSSKLQFCWVPKSEGLLDWLLGVGCKTIKFRFMLWQLELVGYLWWWS